MAGLKKLSFTITEQDLNLLDELINLGEENFTVSIHELREGMFEYAILFRAEYDISELKENLGDFMKNAIIVDVSEKDWLSENIASFKPLTIKNFYIYGSHIKDPPPAGLISIQVNAATAFGSGEHATTAGCLSSFFEHILKAGLTPKSVLDLGAGTAILAIASSKTLPSAQILATDIDEEAVRVSALNAKINEVNIKTLQSAGYEKISGKFELIFANILANPLIELAPGLKEHLASSGIAILSGFLSEQTEKVLAAHTALGLKEIARLTINGWDTLVLRA